MSDRSQHPDSEPSRPSEDEILATDKPWSPEMQRLIEHVRQCLPDEAAYQTDRTKYLIDASNLVLQRQSFEAGWVGQRMSWLVISQSFLFNAFANAAAQHSIATLVLLKWLVPIMGLVQAVATALSIRAASAVDGELYKTRSILDVGLRLFAPGMERLPPLGDVRVGRTAGTRWRGALASRVIPATLIVVWVILLGMLVLTHYFPTAMHHAMGLWD